MGERLKNRGMAGDVSERLDPDPAYSPGCNVCTHTSHSGRLSLFTPVGSGNSLNNIHPWLMNHPLRRVRRCRGWGAETVQMERGQWSSWRVYSLPPKAWRMEIFLYLTSSPKGIPSPYQPSICLKLRHPRVCQQYAITYCLSIYCTLL